MSRWNARRAARRGPRPVVPGWPGNAVALDLPASTPVDVAELARLAAVDGPALLAGRDPEAVGLLVVHPHSPVCPDGHARAHRVVCRVVRLSWLQQLATRLRLRGDLDAGPGRFAAVLVGASQSARMTLTDPAAGLRRAS